MKYQSENDPIYNYPKTKTLRNKFEIKDPDLLIEVEQELSKIRQAELELEPPLTTLNLNHLKFIHYHLFQDIYEWAGELRNVNITKASTRFANASEIERMGNHIFDQLAKEQHLTGLSPEAFSQRAGYYLGEINVLHPFREGNGRAQRIFFSHLASNANYWIDWSLTTQSEMIDACVRAYRGDPTALAAIIARGLSPAL